MPAGRETCILRIRRPARPRLESKAVPRVESSLAGTRGTGFFAASLTPLLGLLVPSRCGVCEAPRVDVGGGGVCRSCWGALPVLDPASTCPHCALPSGGSACAACRLHPPAVTRAVAFGLYAGGLRTLHHAFKFAGWDLLAAPLGERLAALARSTAIVSGADALVPVPSTRRRNRDRGYDPAMLLADETGRRLATPRRNFLVRTRETPPQSALPAPFRRANVEGAFASSRRARGRVLVLVDDVVTTGATLFEAARALREAGAGDVRALVLARTPEPA